MSNLFQHIGHFLRSNSRHGTHSPFVFAVADQALYRQTVPVESVVQDLETIPAHYRNVLSRMLHYWNKEKVYEIKAERTTGDVLFIKAEDLSERIIGQHLNNNSILVVDGIYQTKRTRYAWQRAQQENQVTVSIDLFHFGLLICRTGQVKEDFKLRYPFWIK